MRVFFETPFLFWYVFIFSFLLCTGAGAIIQCWFFINFCDLKSKKRYYIIYLTICYAQYLFAISVDIRISPLLDTLIGTGIIFILLNKLLKQDCVLSAITATLTMAIIALSESTLFLAENFAFNFTAIPQNIILVACGLWFTDCHHKPDHL